MSITDSTPAPANPTAPVRRPVLVLVEGHRDVQFMLRIAEVLHVHDPALPDLADCEAAGRLVFIPVSGDLARWAHRFAPLGLPELHRYDCEVEPVASARRALVAQVNRRPGCGAFLTTKRSVENYLHPDAVYEASGVHIDIDDTADVPERLARQVLVDQGGTVWEDVPHPGQRKLRDKAKQVLCTLAVEMMTMDRLAERDPVGEAAGWLAALGRLLGG